jgi:hypothetical protein
MQLVIEMDPARRMEQITKLIEEIIADTDLLDAAGDLNTISKQIDVPLKDAKAALKAEAEKRKVKKLEGTRYDMSIAQSSDWDINPINLVKWLKDHAKMELFPQLVKAKITEIKQYLGAEMLKDIGKQEINEYGTARFKKKG